MPGPRPAPPPPRWPVRHRRRAARCRRRSGRSRGPCRRSAARRPAPSASTPRRIASARSPTSLASGAPASTAARIAAGSSLRGLSSVTMTRSAVSAAACAHQRPLGPVAVAAGADDGDQPAQHMRAQRRQRRGHGVGRMGVIDEDRGAVGRGWRPAASARAPWSGRAAWRTPRSGVVAGGDDEPAGQQHVLGLEAADQVQPDLVRARPCQVKRMSCPVASKRWRQQVQIAETARRRSAPRWPRAAAMARISVPRGVVEIDHRDAVLGQHPAEQPGLGGEIGLEIWRDSRDDPG